MAANLQGLLSDPRFLEFSLGLLAQSGSVGGRPAPSTLQAIGRSGLSAFGTQNERLRNQILRDQLTERERRKELLRQVPGLLSDTAITQGPDRNFTIAGVEGLGDTDFSIPSRKEIVPLLSTPGGQSKLIGLLADVAPEALLSQLTSQLFSEPDKPIGLEAKFNTIEGRLGRPLTDEEILKLSGSGTTINIGDKLNEPIPIAQLASVRLPDGNSVPIGTTFSQARTVGAQVVSPDERKSKENARSAEALLDQLEALAVGPEGIFNQVEPGFFNRVGAAFQFALEDISQPGAGKVSRFKDLSLGVIATFVRTMGEKGALSDGDVQRALGLLPRIFPLPDTGRVARDKLRELREIIDKGVRNTNIRNQPDVSGNAPPSLLSDAGTTLSGLTAQVPGLLSNAGDTISGLAAQVPGLLSDAGDTLSGLTAQVPGFLSDAGETGRQLSALLAANIPQDKIKDLSKRSLAALADKLREVQVLTASEVKRAKGLLAGSLTAKKFKEFQEILAQASLRTQKTIGLNNGFTLEISDE